MERLEEYVMVLEKFLGDKTEELVVIRAELRTDAVPNWRRLELEKKELQFDAIIKVVEGIIGSLRTIAKEARVN